MKTTRYVAVHEGEGPGTSRTILATADPDAVAAVVQLLQEHMSRTLHPATPAPNGGQPKAP